MDVEETASAARSDVQEDSKILTPYGTCRAVMLTAKGTLVAEIERWTLASGQCARVYFPDAVTSADDDKVSSSSKDEVDGASKDEDKDMDASAPSKFAFDAPKSDHSLATLSAHNDSVYAVAAKICGGKEKKESDGTTLVATGGGDDSAYLYKVTAGGAKCDVVAKLGGHTDSVVAVAFNHNGDYLATGGYDGCVKIWHATGKHAGDLVGTLEGPSQEIEWIQWHRKGDVILAGSGDGSTWMWHGPWLKFMQVFTGHEGRVHCGGFTPNGKLVVTGSEDSTLRVWDPQTGKCKHKFEGHLWHKDAVVAIGMHHKRPLVITGSTDGTVCVAHARKQKNPRQLSSRKDRSLDEQETERRG